MKVYKMSANDAWNAEDNNFRADVLVKTDDNNKYQSSEVCLTSLGVNNLVANIKLNINGANRYKARLELLEKMPEKFKSGDEVLSYAAVLKSYGDFMELLVEEANMQLRAVDGLFKEEGIAL